MSGWNDVSAPVSSEQTGWDAVSSAQPKLPDTTGVQQMARDNLSDNKEAEIKAPQTPEQRADTALGMPLEKTLHPDDETAFPAPIRRNLIKSYANGTADNAGDFMQSALHSVMPIIAGGIQRAEHPLNFAGQIAEGAENMVKGGASLIAYPFLSQENKQELRENGTFPPLSDYKDVENPTLTEQARRGIELEQSTLGKGMGTLYYPIASLVGPAVNPIIQSSGGKPTEAGEIPTAQSLIPGALGVVMDIAGAFGVAHGAGELSALRQAKASGPQFSSGGPWDNHLGNEIIKNAVSKIIDKPADSVTSQDIDQAIAQGITHKAPTAQDFKSVETVTNGKLPEKSLHMIYAETGVKPDQVFEDASANPQITKDISDGKIPETYEHLVDPKPELTPEKAETLQISRDDTSKTFNVVDADGDHVQGGFDSAEEAKHYIEDKKEGVIPDEPTEWKEQKSAEEKTEAGEQSIIPGAEKISDKELAERNMEGAKKPQVEQKPANEGLFDVAGRGQADLLDLINKENGNEKLPIAGSPAGEVGEIPERNEGNQAKNAESPHADRNSGKTLGNAPLRQGAVAPSEIGKPTSLYTFLRNNGGIKDEGGNLASMGEKSLIRKNGMDWDDATELAQQHGYFSERPSIPELQNALLESNAGREHFRDQDIERNIKAKEKKAQDLENDPVYVEHYADSLGIDTDKLPNETDRQFVNRLKEAIKDFYKNQEGKAAVDVYRKALGDIIKAAEAFAGKLTGGLFEKLADGYIKTFQPELMGDKAARADAYMAKYKASLQEAENAYYTQSSKTKAAFDRLTHDERMQWLYDHETGRWNEKDNPEHARYQALYDVMHKAEREIIGDKHERGYKENYLPHQWEDPDAVNAYFHSDAMIKKYGASWFNKASEFKLVQEGVRAGFKLKTDNPESMLVARQLASHNMIATMNLLKDMESSGIAAKASLFTLDKRIAKTQETISDLEKKYQAASDKINDPAQIRWDFADPAVNKYMKAIQKRMDSLRDRAEDFNKQKSENNFSSEQMKDLKDNGFKIIGPDNRVWSINQQVRPLWKNAMEMKGLWENQGVMGDAYRGYTAAKALWTSVKLGLSLFHPVHVAMIHLASGIAAMGEHLIQGGKVSDLALEDTGYKLGLTGNTLKGTDHPAVAAWKTIPEERTPEQQRMVTTMIEGGFKPTLSARDTIHFKENFDKAIDGVGLNNLRLIGTALQLPGKLFAPFFEHWIPGMKSEIYLRRADEAMVRDPSLVTDVGKRGEVLRQIAKDTDRTYGEMNNDVQFWNRTIRDSFNAAFISGGWKLAQIYNARGLLQPAEIAYKFAKTGEFNKEDLTYNMLQAYAYTGLTLALGGAINSMMGNPIGTAKDTVWDVVKNLIAPQTGEKNPDGTPIRLNQPAFAKEAYNLAHEINTKGLVSGSGSFLYHQTLIPGIADTLNNRDFTGRKIISDPTDLHQWMNAGWDSISPISIGGYQKAESKHSEIGKVAGILGFPMAGAYMNQTPFEQKVIYTYDEQNPPKGDAYSVKLKSDLRTAIASGDAENIEKVKQTMKNEGMTDRQISNAQKIYTKPFVEDAWKKLPIEDQKRLIDSASEEEKKKFSVGK